MDDVITLSNSSVWTTLILNFYWFHKQFWLQKIEKLFVLAQFNGNLNIGAGPNILDCNVCRQWKKFEPWIVVINVSFQSMSSFFPILLRFMKFNDKRNNYRILIQVRFRIYLIYELLDMIIFKTWLYLLFSFLKQVRNCIFAKCKIFFAYI